MSIRSSGGWVTIVQESESAIDKKLVITMEDPGIDDDHIMAKAYEAVLKLNVRIATITTVQLIFMGLGVSRSLSLALWLAR